MVAFEMARPVAVITLPETDTLAAVGERGPTARTNGEKEVVGENRIARRYGQSRRRWINNTDFSCAGDGRSREDDGKLVAIPVAAANSQ